MTLQELRAAIKAADYIRIECGPGVYLRASKDDVQQDSEKIIAQCRCEYDDNSEGDGKWLWIHSGREV